MAVMCLCFLFLLLAGNGFSQCFTDTDCTGSLVPAANQKECCAGTNEGFSYNDGGTCNLCTGMSGIAIDSVFNADIFFVQFTDLLKLRMMWMRMIDWTLTSDSM